MSLSLGGICGCDFSVLSVIDAISSLWSIFCKPILLSSHDVTLSHLPYAIYLIWCLVSCLAHSCTHHNCHIHCLMSTEPHRSAMWSFAQTIDLPLVMVACHPLAFPIASTNTLTGLVHLISFAYDSLDPSMCILYRSLPLMADAIHLLLCSFLMV